MPAEGDFAFGPFLLDTRAKQLCRDGEPVLLSPRLYTVLHALVTHPGHVFSKDDLVKLGWADVVVGDSSVEKLIHQLRERLDPEPERYIATVPRRGYRFVGAVTSVERRGTDEELAALLEPHLMWVTGRAALESLEAEQTGQARRAFEHLVRLYPGHAPFHIGLANACVMQFESTRTDAAPDIPSLRLAVTHARKACFLSPNLAEAWATLGFVLQRAGKQEDALGALVKAVMLDAGNWMHQCRLAMGSWGGQRLEAVRHTLAACPHLPIARLLSAMVHVARHALAEAERELDAALTIVEAEAKEATRFPAIALYWLKGLLLLARGEIDEAMAAFDRELARESRGHIYARECAANAWHAKGVCYLLRAQFAAARDAFGEALARVPLHPGARAGLHILSRRESGTTTRPERMEIPADGTPLHFERQMAQAALFVDAGDLTTAVRIVADALAAAGPGGSGWMIPIDPLLRVADYAAEYAPVLATLHIRAR